MFWLSNRQQRYWQAGPSPDPEVVDDDRAAMVGH